MYIEGEILDLNSSNTKTCNGSSSFVYALQVMCRWQVAYLYIKKKSYVRVASLKFWDNYTIGSCGMS
jgi:hypothetical protein